MCDIGYEAKEATAGDAAPMAYVGVIAQHVSIIRGRTHLWLSSWLRPHSPVVALVRQKTD